MTAATEAGTLRCLACEGTGQRTTLTVRGGTLVHECAACGQLFVDPQPSDETLAAIYGAGYFLETDVPTAEASGSGIKRQSARLQLDALARYTGGGTGTLLEVGCGNGEFLIEAAHRGFDVRGIDVSPHAVQVANRLLGREAARCSTIERANIRDHEVDVCVCADVLEHMRDPTEFLSEAHRILKPNGVLLVVTPAIDSWPARTMKRHWFEFKTEHLHYFSRLTLQNVLARTGFRAVEVATSRKILTLDYITRHFQRFPVPVWTALLRVMTAVLPASLRHAPMRVPTSSVIAFARAEPRRPRPLVSVIVPVLNERTTVGPVLEALLAKQLQAADKEIIIVESNSADGSRAEVLRFKGEPGVQIVLQDRPRGKGNAVREGLRHATGDFVVIQDADLEYDINDYDRLLAPLRSYRQAVVMGSRHAGRARIRDFTDQWILGLAFNSGHVLLTALFNRLYRQRLKDPWTMYKVFRRDCLHSLSLECNRFDFDVELLAKLIRKGYAPIELPITYRSRSFKEGKKINIVTDPWTWIWTCVKCRFVSPYEEKRTS